MTPTQTALKRTPLFEEHLALKARMVPFGGWEMPVQYEGILAEHEHTRQSASLFDTSHMGEFIIEGDYMSSGLDFLITMTIDDMLPKTCRYGLLLNDQGGVMDDLILFRVDKNKWFIVVNGATIEKDAKQFKNNLEKRIVFKDLSSQTGKLDLQGPKSREVLSQLVKGIEKLDYYTFDYFNLLGENTLISRTGYTGELGYEIYFPWDKTVKLWREILKNKDVKPAGLGARDILRLEVGYSLYGHELNDTITPLEAGLNRFVDFNKDFFGKKSLLEQQTQGIRRKIVGFTSDNRRAPRAEQKIYSEKGEEIGFVTSGTFSPCLNKGIGLGFVAFDFAQQDKKILFGDDKITAAITGRIFYKNGSLKN